jgi:MOB kinase activator 1
VKGSFKTIVAPPKYVDVNEWVAINGGCQTDASFTLACAMRLLITRSRGPVFDFYQNLNHFYDVVSEFCTVQSCSKMGAASE